MKWNCSICGKEHGDLPTCFGMEAPWRDLVPEAEFQTRVELNVDQCIVDGKHFFVRGHIEIPIHGHAEPLAFSVWSSLSEKSFAYMCRRYDDADRGSDPPYFGWLANRIAVYPSDRHLALSVQSRPPGLTPLFTMEPTDHPLSLDQRRGISIARWHELARQNVGP